MRSTVSSKGQITIPAELRAALGLRAGTPIVFEQRPEGALIRKGSRGVHPVDAAFGRIHLRADVDSLLDAMRGERPARRGTRTKGVR